MAGGTPAGSSRTGRVPARRPAASRRLGYIVAIIVNGALLYIINVWPGWQAASILTSATRQVLGLVNLVVAAGVAVNVLYLAHDPPWLRSLGDLVTAAIGLAAAIRIWQVFPFDFHGSTAWSVVVRTVLVLAMVGSAIAIVVQLVSLARRAIRRNA
ncbi:MAG TPA: hypothetical protein VNF47_11655 [Streptosporangiaceae bacterium]|nr:hypothetical protein [Streptosporangiaceae bacterium]